MTTSTTSTRTARRIATSNLYNLADAGMEYYPGRKYSDTYYARKIKWLGHRFATIRADLVGVQEVFSQQALTAAVQAANSLDGDPAYPNAIVIADGYGPSQPAVGLVTTLPIIEEAVYHTDFPADAVLHDDFQRFSRPVLKVGVALAEGETASVFVTHLKSKRGIFASGEDEADPLAQARASARALLKRACEATALRSLVLSELERDQQQRAVIVLGDLNDAAHAVTTVAVGGQTYMGYLPGESKQERSERIERSWRARLYSAWDIQFRRPPRDVYFTHIFDGLHESLDHIFVSEEFNRRNPKHRWTIDRTEVLNDQLGTDGRADPWASDHGSVVTTLRPRS
ncbi:MAG: nuclease [Haliangiales bacterium]